jgi:hypothetical protein
LTGPSRNFCPRHARPSFFWEAAELATGYGLIGLKSVQLAYGWPLVV